ncbi:antiterminator LoaP [Brevibacillus sp. HB1.3]|uniref:antiterminator LoaP n=1 Tax=Brevibacillus sp. HB1.3 TaxID=2738842 RepID=UPI0015534543|nr:antiterminator LoaP [Brevibacillus sp. HB1.3]NQF16931.1 antiterminator LoaP [Brevibacillus sp. HB1.3]
MNWYALYVETGYEERVAKFLSDKFSSRQLRAVVPKRRLPERKQGLITHPLKIMFPGYLLIQTNMDTKTYYDLKETPRTFRLLNNNKQIRQRSDGLLQVSEIEEAEIRPILKMLDTDGVLGYSTLMIIDSKITVKKGPLAGKEGIIKKVNRRKKRAKIVIDFLGDERMIDVGIEILE